MFVLKITLRVCFKNYFQGIFYHLILRSRIFEYIQRELRKISNYLEFLSVTDLRFILYFDMDGIFEAFEIKNDESGYEPSPPNRLNNANLHDAINLCHQM